MIRNQRVAVVVPAFNEEKWIEQVIESLPACVDRLIIVDDASKDSTVEHAQRAQTACEKIILRQPQNEGVGAAIVRGYRYAFGHGDDVAVVMAGDGQMDPLDLQALVEPIAADEADYVKGNRLRHAEVRDTMPRNRRLGSYVLSTLTSAVIGQVIGDSQCGYTAMGRHAFSQLNARSLWPRYGYPNDLLAALALEGARIQDVVVRPIYRGEASGMHAGHVFTITALLSRAAARRGIRLIRDQARLAGPAWLNEARTRAVAAMRSKQGRTQS